MSACTAHSVISALLWHLLATKLGAKEVSWITTRTNLWKLVKQVKGTINKDNLGCIIQERWMCVWSHQRTKIELLLQYDYFCRYCANNRTAKNKIWLYDVQALIPNRSRNWKGFRAGSGIIRDVISRSGYGILAYRVHALVMSSTFL
jgi:hypothetical protein